MVYSFSRLTTFEQCPYKFYLSYIECLEGIDNFFSDYGHHGHSLLEKYLKKEIELYELSDLYTKDYLEVVKHQAPPNKFVDLNESYYRQGKEYFDNFNGFEDYEVIAVEKEVLFEIEGIKIKGFIDVLARDKEGNLHIIDHKSSDPKSAESEKAKEYWKQMALYSIPIKEEYGVYPKQLHINAFRKQQWFKKNLEEQDIVDVKKWVVDTVKKISEEENWLPCSDGYFCNFICGYRGTCEYRPQGV